MTVNKNYIFNKKVRKINCIQNLDGLIRLDDAQTLIKKFSFVFLMCIERDIDAHTDEKI